MLFENPLCEKAVWRRLILLILSVLELAAFAETVANEMDPLHPWSEFADEFGHPILPDISGTRSHVEIGGKV
jgi:hypothetical protein